MADDEHDPVVEQLRAWADDLVSRTETSVRESAVVRRRWLSTSLAAGLVAAAAVAAIVVVQQRSGAHGVTPVSPTPATTSTVLDVATVPVTTNGPTSSTPVTETAPSTAETALRAIDFNLDGEPGSKPSVFGFGHQLVVDFDAVSPTIRPVLGAPDLDTGWLPMPESLACKGATEYRSIVWNDLRLVFEGHDINNDAVTDLIVLTGWSIGNVALNGSPPLAGSIAEASGLTTVDGIGLGSAKSAILALPWVQVSDEGDRVFGSAGSTVVFDIADDRVSAISVEDNDC